MHLLLSSLIVPSFVNMLPLLAFCAGNIESKMSAPIEIELSISCGVPIPMIYFGFSLLKCFIPAFIVLYVCFTFSPMHSPPNDIPSKSLSFMNFALSALRSGCIPPCIIPNSSCFWFLCAFLHLSAQSCVCFIDAFVVSFLSVGFGTWSRHIATSLPSSFCAFIESSGLNIAVLPFIGSLNLTPSSVWFM